MRQQMLENAIVPQHSGVVLWHRRFPNKCYTTEDWEDMSADEQADAIDAGVNNKGKKRTNYRQSGDGDTTGAV